MAEAETLEATLYLSVFTHPACSGCSPVVRRAWKLGEAHSGVEMRTVNLERASGLAEARSEGVRTIPTVILSSSEGELRRWTGAPAPGALEAALEELCSSD